MTYRLVILRRAQDDVERIAHWLRKRSHAGMIAWRYALGDALQEILAEPLRWSRVAEGKRLPVGLRQFLFRTRAGNVYRIVYFIEGCDIRILRVRAPGQRPLRPKDVQG
jgi:plasmid stabilization system protein ParE